MNRTIFAIAALAVFALTACQNELCPNDCSRKDSEFTALTEGSITRTALSENGGNYDVVWHGGDQIAIADHAETPNVGVYQTTSTTTSGAFSFVSGNEASVAPFKAYYPASIYGLGTPELPATQTYAENNISGSPMYAESGTSTLGFKNICGIIRLNISTSQTGVKVRRIVFTSDQGMSGAISNAASLVKDNYEAAVSGKAGVTLDCGEDGVAIDGTAKSFHIAVPANGYTSLSITIEATDGTTQTRISNKSISVQRSKITEIDLPYDSFAAFFAYSSNLSSVLAEFNASKRIDPRLYIMEDVKADLYVTRDDGVIDLKGHTITGNLFLQNNDVHKSIYVRNGTVTSGIDGKPGQSDYFAGGVVLDDITADVIWNDGHAYIINSGTYNRIELKKNGSTPGTMIIHGGFFKDIYRYYENYPSSQSPDGCAFTIYGGTFAQDHSAWCASGYSLKANTGSDSGTYPYVVQADRVAGTVDLSATATANTYMVHRAGRYSFNATVKGNGGLDPLTGTTATTIDPASIAGVKVLWELYEQGRAIMHDGSNYDISYSDGNVHFSTPVAFGEGDACVAIVDAEDNILWSWVIWTTYDPGTMEYNSKTFMGRNLGAIDIGNCIRGFLYQWGRKDAFSAANGGYSPYTYFPAAATLFSASKERQTMQYAISNPTTYIGNGGSWMVESDYAAKPWRDDVKTIYDPCPAGWRVPRKGDLNNYGKFPNTGLRSNHDDIGGFGNPYTGYAWYSTTDEGADPNAYAFVNDGRKATPQHWAQDQGYAIRPIRE